MELEEIKINTSYDAELEKAVLGAVLLEKEAYGRIEELLNDSDFYDPKNQIIFSVIQKLHKELKPIDIITVSQELKSSGKIKEISPLYISDLVTDIASSAHLEYHAQILKQKAVERNSIAFFRNAIKKIESAEDIGDVLFHTSKQLEIQQEALIGKQTTLHISNALSESISNMYERVSLFDQGKQSGINTGLSKLNKATNGWQSSELIVLAARPAMGKTALMLHFAKVAAKNNTPVALFSLEMSSVSLSDRLILSECENIDADRFKSGNLAPDETKAIEKAVGYLWNLPIYVDDNACVTMDYIRSRSRVLNKQGKCDMVLIDYLQLAQDSAKSPVREQAISMMSRTAKIIAKELNVPVILLSQLNRGAENRPDKKPLLSDLRESGAIEQDADKVIFIYRPEYYGIEATDENGALLKNCGQLLIAKNRNGATGIVGFSHNESLTKIFDYQPINSNPF